MTFLGKLKASATCPEEVAGIEKVIYYLSAGSLTKRYLKEESNTRAIYLAGKYSFNICSPTAQVEYYAPEKKVAWFEMQTYFKLIEGPCH